MIIEVNCPEAATEGVLYRKTPVLESLFKKDAAWETQTQAFSFKISEIFQNTYFEDQLWAAESLTVNANF